MLSNHPVEICYQNMYLKAVNVHHPTAIQPPYGEDSDGLLHCSQSEGSISFSQSEESISFSRRNSYGSRSGPQVSVASRELADLNGHWRSPPFGAGRGGRAGHGLTCDWSSFVVIGNVMDHVMGHPE
eukprot:2580800-Rhodomonas_salina.2